MSLIDEQGRRKDVLSLARRLNEKARMDEDSVYYWLMGVGKASGKNPCNLEFDARDGMVYMVGDADNNRIERYVPPTPWQPSYNGPDYEELILARQDAWWGDYL